MTRRKKWLVGHWEFIYFLISFDFFFFSEKPQKWRVEISSNQKKVKTVWQLSDSSPIDHSSFQKPGKDDL